MCLFVNITDRNLCGCLIHRFVIDFTSFLFGGFGVPGFGFCFGAATTGFAVALGFSLAALCLLQRALNRSPTLEEAFFTVCF